MDILQSLLIQYQLGKTLHCHCAHVYQISGAPGRIDWDKNRKEDSMLKIQSKSRATSAVSHLGLICQYEVWSVTSASSYTLSL